MSPDVCALAPHPLAGGTVVGRLGCRISMGETSLDVCSYVIDGVSNCYAN